MQVRIVLNGLYQRERIGERMEKDILTDRQSNKTEKLPGWEVTVGIMAKSCADVFLLYSDEHTCRDGSSRPDGHVCPDGQAIAQDIRDAVLIHYFSGVKKVSGLDLTQATALGRSKIDQVLLLYPENQTIKSPAITGELEVILDTTPIADTLERAVA